MFLPSSFCVHRNAFTVFNSHTFRRCKQIINTFDLFSLEIPLFYFFFCLWKCMISMFYCRNQNSMQTGLPKRPPMPYLAQHDELIRYVHDAWYKVKSKVHVFIFILEMSNVFSPIFSALIRCRLQSNANTELQHSIEIHPNNDWPIFNRSI